MAQAQNKKKTAAKKTPAKKATASAPAAAPADRRAPYLLKGKSPEPDLLSLFRLLTTLRDARSRIELSGLIRTRLRSLYPAGSGETGTAELKNGLRFDVDLGDLFGAEFFIGNMNEADVLNALNATLPEAATTVDIGANFGLFGVHAGHIAQKGKVIALEPLPSAFELLQKNISQNGLSGRVEAINAAVSKKGGKAEFFVATDGAFSGLRDTGRSPVLETATVDMVALDKCAPVTALDRIDFLKIDTEGHEAEVLAGAHKTLERCKSALVMLEYSHKNLTEDARANLIEELQPLISAGFEAQLYDGSQTLVKLKKASDIPLDTSGTVFLTGENCKWASGFFNALEREVETARKASSENAPDLILREFSKIRNKVADVERLEESFPSTGGATPLSKRILNETKRLRTEIERAETRFQTEIERAEKYRDALQGHYDKADADRKRLRLKSDQLGETVEKYKERIEAFQKVTDSLHEKLKVRENEHAQKIADIRTSFDRQYERAEEMKKSLLESMTARKDLESQLAQADEALKASKQEFSATKRLLTHAEARSTDLEGKLQTAVAARDSLNERMEAFRSLSNDLQQKLEAAKAAQESARRDFDVLISKEKTAHEKTHQDLKQILSDERNAHKRTTAELTREKAAHEKTHSDLKQILSEERNAHKRTSAELAKEKAAHEKTHRDLKYIISEERNALKREKAAHEKTHRDLKMLLSQERAAHSETRQHLDVSRELRADQRLELDEAATRQAALEAEIAALTEEKRALQTEIDEKRALVRILQQREALHEIGLGKHLRQRR